MPPTNSTTAPPATWREQDEIQEIIGHAPSWILHWGITVILFLVLLFGFMSWLIKYPDVLPAPVILTTENPAIRIVAQASGKIERLMVADRNSVRREQVIALVESNARWEDIQRLEQFLREWRLREKKSEIPVPENLALGTLQAPYTRLVQQIQDQWYFLRQQAHEIRVASARDQIEQNRNLQQSLRKQIELYEKELTLAESNYKTSRLLYESGAKSLLDTEKDEAGLLQHQRQLENMEAQLINHEVTIAQLKTQIAEIEQGRQDGKQSRQLAVEETIRQLTSDLAAWRQAYLITAPIAGKVVMSKVWSSQQFVQAGTEIFTLVPVEGTGEIIGKAIMPAAGVGKVQPGMAANLSLEGYPQQEYGLLKAVVEQIALIPETRPNEAASYQLILKLSSGLNTTYGKNIPLRQEMPGIAEIITEDKRILHRVLEQIMNIFKNN